MKKTIKKLSLRKESLFFIEVTYTGTNGCGTHSGPEAMSCEGKNKK